MQTIKSQRNKSVSSWSPEIDDTNTNLAAMDLARKWVSKQNKEIVSSRNFLVAKIKRNKNKKKIRFEEHAVKYRYCKFQITASSTLVLFFYQKH